ncbi:MAG TPA: YHS domain-containing protein [Nitrospiraceae bacterium]|nr:YHS domain-containing protein [Nitrospiraceae bacterium]
MLRLLIVLILLIVLYFLLRNALRELRGDSNRLVDNQMIQDPVCRTYVPKGSAVSARIGGQTYYFCSPGCAESFQKRLSQPG